MFHYRIAVRKQHPTPHPNLENKIFLPVLEWQSDEQLHQKSHKQLKKYTKKKLRNHDTNQLPHGHTLNEVEEEVYLTQNYQTHLLKGEQLPTEPYHKLPRAIRRRLSNRTHSPFQ